MKCLSAHLQKGQLHLQRMLAGMGDHIIHDAH
jgi:hypothetical protein